MSANIDRGQSSFAGGYELDLNLLRPDILGLLEEGERRASLIRVAVLCLALGVWLMVGLRFGEISVIVQERRADEIEVARITEEISAIQAQLGEVPGAVREAKEKLLTEITWANRIRDLRDLAPSGSVFGAYSVSGDGAVQLSGVVREPSIYSELLDALGKTPFVASIKSASLSASESGGYVFWISIATHVDRVFD